MGRIRLPRVRHQRLRAVNAPDALVHYGNRRAQYFSICYTEPLAEADIERSVRSVDDLLDDIKCVKYIVRLKMIRLFYSYCHDEEQALNDLRKEMAVVVKKENITEWYDRMISGGRNLDVIMEELDSSEIIVLLISPGYLASDSCLEEMNRAWERVEQDSIRVVPVIVKRCGWKENDNLRNHLALPTDGRPVDEWEHPGKAWEIVRNHLKQAIEEQVNRFMIRHVCNEDFREGMNEMVFVRQGKKTIGLRDLFVMPNIVSERSDEKREIRDIGDLTLDGVPTVLIGENQSGKSTIARYFWMHSWDNDLPALILDGKEIQRRKPEQVLRSAFSKQCTGDWTKWMDNADKLLIVDNASSVWNSDFSDYVENRFDNILYTMSDDEYLAQLRDQGRLAEYRTLRITTLTHGVQEKLIARWLEFNGDETTSLQKHQKIDELEDHVNSIIGRNRIVPRFPFFVLSILQTREMFMPQDLQITAYAHCYRSLIIAHLIKSRVASTDLDGAMNLLTELAYRIYVDRKKGNRTIRDDFLDQYRRQFVLNEGMFSKIEQTAAVIRTDEEGNIQFTYKFAYFYFLGWALSQRYQVCKQEIETLASTIFRSDDANTLLFLLHHSRSEDLLETILLHAMVTLGDTPIAKLSAADTMEFSKALDSIPKSLPAESIADIRTRERRGRDVMERREGEVEVDEDHFTHSEVYRALRHMEILGQVLRNQYGSLPKDRLSDVISTIVNTGLQLIHMFTNKEFLEKEEQHIRVHVANRPRRKRDGGKEKPLSSDKIRGEVSRRLRTLAVLVIAVLVTKTITCIWRRELVPVVHGVCKKADDSAHRLISTLFEVTTRARVVDRDGDLIRSLFEELQSDGNFVVARIFSLLVQHHLRTHDAEVALRQKISDALGIAYQPALIRQRR